MPEPNLTEWARAAEEWAAEAGVIALSALGRADVQRKPDGTEVTGADLAIQGKLAQYIRDSFPRHALIAEETLEGFADLPPPATARFCWVIDPLDGTRNFIRGYPAFSTSVALMEEGRPILGVVRWHHTGQVFAAVAGGGATLNGRPMRASQTAMDASTLVGAQLGPNHRTQDVVAPWLSRWAVRNMGATSLHLALVASGGLGAAYAKDCWIWDLAAGALLISEAGGLCTGTNGDPIFPVNPATCATTNYPFIAGGPAAHQALLLDLNARGVAWASDGAPPLTFPRS